MGIIKKQAISNSLFSYFGILLGLLITGFLFPKYFSSEQNGLLKLIVSYGLLFGQFANLGLTMVTAKIFPVFRNNDNNHNGFLFISFIINCIGLLLSCSLFLLLCPFLLDLNIDKSSLFIEYIYLIIPLIISFSIFNTLEAYNKSLFDSVSGTFFRDVLQRVLLLISAVLYIFNYINFHLFVIFYVVSFVSPFLFILGLLYYRKQISLKYEKEFLTSGLKSKIVNIATYGILTSFLYIIVVQIDVIMISKYLGLSATGIYAITFYFGAVIIVPARALGGISISIFSESWNKNDLKEIFLVYKKNTITQFIIGSAFFTVIWVNINNIFEFLPDIYAAGKYVILFIGIQNLLEMLSGNSSHILITSKNHKVITYFSAIFLILLILTNMILIPSYGITGAAIASAISTLIFTILRSYYLFSKFKMQPYGMPHIKTLSIILICLLINYFLYSFENYIVDGFIRTILISTIFILLTYYLKISKDINELIQEKLKLIKI